MSTGITYIQDAQPVVYYANLNIRPACKYGKYDILKNTYRNLYYIMNRVYSGFSLVENRALLEDRRTADATQ